MKRLAASLLVAASTLFAQTPAKIELLNLMDQLEAAIQAGDWSKAAQLSRSLRGDLQEARNRSLAVTGQELADSILTWLPLDTETVAVAQQPFTIPAKDGARIPGALDIARGYILGLLAAAEKPKLVDALTGRTLRLALLAARRFGEEPASDPHGEGPSPLGLIPYQGCAVYAFADPVPESVMTRPPEDSIMGHPVWISRGTQNDKTDRDTYRVSLLKPDLLLVCNNREFFEQILSRMGLPAGGRALPASLPEWKQLDRAAPLWGMSHYRGNGLVQAMLSPRGADLGATGITVEFGLASGGVRARMISKSDPWQNLVGAHEFLGAAHSRQTSTGIWELSVEGKPEAAGLAAFALMGALGFVVVI